MQLMPVTVFVPHDTSKFKKGWLLGRYAVTGGNGSAKSNVIVITAVTEKTTEESQVIGHILQHDRKARNEYGGSSWVVLQTDTQVSLVSLQFNCVPADVKFVNVVIYDPREILRSEVIYRKFYNETNENDDVISFFVHVLFKQNMNLDNRNFSSDISPFSHLWYGWLWILVSILQFCVTIPKCILETCDILTSRSFNSSSTTAGQISLRYRQLVSLKKELQRHPQSLKCWRLLGVVFVDVALGCLIALMFGNATCVTDIYDDFCASTKLLANNITELLKWLSVAPAGLKLNQPLTEALATFFSYHIYLWVLYLEYAKPLLLGLAWSLVYLGILGASVQVAILSDLLNLATLHLYCFYVYAARMHMLQVSLLVSQWRAFRGLKWNPLKERIDSYDLSGHRSPSRVLTVVVFTFAVFLLPTTLVYYAVFLSMKICLQLVHGILCLIVWVFNVNPTALILYYMIGDQRIRGNLYFSADNSHTNITPQQELLQYLRLSVHPTPIAEVLHLTHSEVFPTRPQPDWPGLCHSILTARQLL